MKKYLRATECLLILVAVLVAATAQTTDEARYRDATNLINEEQWSKAIEAFDEVVAAGGSRTDAALYWKAYAQEKRSLSTEALATLNQLKRSFPQSSWLDDARALELTLRRRAGMEVEPELEANDDLKLIAINSLMQSDRERALPLLQKVLSGSHSDKVKSRALFVLAHSGAAEGKQTLIAVAKDSANPYLQRKAIQYLGALRGEQNNGLLAEIYAGALNTEVKERILKSLMVAGGRDELVRVAREEPDPELREEAVKQLGVMRATDELWALYGQEQAAEVRESVVTALFLARDSSRLAQIAKSDSDQGVREEAIEKLGLIKSTPTETLSSLYSSATANNDKESVLKALFLRNDATTLIQLARAETNPELREEAVKILGRMRSQEARDYLLEILGQ